MTIGHDKERISLDIDTDTLSNFKRAVFENKGMKKGNLTKAFEEAMNLWATSYFNTHPEQQPAEYTQKKSPEAIMGVGMIVMSTAELCNPKQRGRCNGTPTNTHQTQQTTQITRRRNSTGNQLQ